MKKPILTTLSNGVRVLMIPQPGALTATALVLVRAGLLTESKEENGLSHFLEHMFFKGTVKYPSTKAIVEVFEKVGAISNAFTATEYTGYYAKGAPRHLHKFIDMLHDMYVNATFPEAELEKERGVIIEEINMYEDMPQQKVGEALLSIMYGDQPAGRAIAGPKEQIRAYTRADMVRYKDRQYHASNTLVVVSGDVDPKNVRTQLAQTFGTIGTGNVGKKPSVRIDQKELRTILISKKLDQTHLAIGFHGVPFGHKDARVYSLLATILGRGLSSRLSQRLREELGAAYYVGAGNDMHRTYGMFEITAGVDKRRVQEILGHIAVMLKELTETLVSDAELHKAREYAIGMQRMALESSDDIAGFYGAQLMMGDALLSPRDLEKLYRCITPGDIRRVARTVFRSSRATIALIGPHAEGEIDTSPFLAL